MSRQIYMIFFLLQHTPARRRWNIGTVSECRDAIHCVSTGNAMWDFFPPRAGILFHHHLPYLPLPFVFHAVVIDSGGVSGQIQRQQGLALRNSMFAAIKHLPVGSKLSYSNCVVKAIGCERNGRA